jgi:hypothetical protein
VRGPQRRLFVRAREQIPLGIEILSIRAAGGLHERGHLLIGAPLHDAVVGLVSEKDVSVCITRGALGKAEALVDSHEFGIRCGYSLHVIGRLRGRWQNRSGERHKQGKEGWGFHLINFRFINPTLGRRKALFRGKRPKSLRPSETFAVISTSF